VGACSKQARLGLDVPDRGQDTITAGRIGKPLPDVEQHPGRFLVGSVALLLAFALLLLAAFAGTVGGSTVGGP
jgi:hypothetical protein